MQQVNYHHGDLRNSLLNMGIEMLNEKGIAGISLREISRSIGVGHNAPYRHFRNKQELLEAIAEDGFRRLKAKNTRLELEFSSDPEQQLFESAMHIISMAEAQSNLYQLMFGGFICVQTCCYGLKEAVDEAMQSLVAIVVNGQNQGVFVPGDGVKLAISTMAMVQGLAMMVSSGHLSISSESSLEPQTALRGKVLQLFDVFLMGLKVK